LRLKYVSSGTGAAHVIGGPPPKDDAPIFTGLGFAFGTSQPEAPAHRPAAATPSPAGGVPQVGTRFDVVCERSLHFGAVLDFPATLSSLCFVLITAGPMQSKLHLH
jgi:hypothetical protein